MVPPADVVAQSDVFEAIDRSGATGLFARESFNLGPYQVWDVDRDWNRGGASTFGFSDLGYTSGETTTGFSFRFREGTETLTGKCASLTERGGLVLGNSRLTSAETRLSCSCGAGHLLATLELSGDEDKPRGKLTLPRGTFEVTSVHETNTSMARPLAGLRVDGASEPVGAVEILHPGRIWLSRTLDDTERHQVACLLTGVMLYVPPDDD